MVFKESVFMKGVDLNKKKKVERKVYKNCDLLLGMVVSDEGFICVGRKIMRRAYRKCLRRCFFL